jgi:hypothetical protein
VFTAREIEKATDGYVNSGVLRQWIMKGYIEAGPRAKLPGGPRTFVIREVVKAVLIAELRRCGISLEVASNSAEQIARHDDQHMKRKADEPGGSHIHFVLVDPQRNRVSPITLSESSLPFVSLVSGDSVLVLNYVNIHERALRARASWADLSGAAK